MKQSFYQPWIWGGIVLCSFQLAQPVGAQIVPDSTLPNNSRVNRVGNTSIIEGGTQVGGNLFHSFQQFSVIKDATAFFNNPADIQNIISRVTGGSVSNINGIIQAHGTANLFLINPSGIIFGQNARLNIGGSFLATTASSLNFADGTKFSATAPQTTPLLTISVPIGLQFEGATPPIIVQGSGNTLKLAPTVVRGAPDGLVVKPGKTLALVGGDVNLESGNAIAQSGRVEVGSVASPGLVSLTTTDQGWSLGYSGVPTFGDIKLSGRASIDASSDTTSAFEVGSGHIQVQGRRVTVEDGSAIFALNSGSKPGGVLTVNASDRLELIGTSSDNFPSALLTYTLGAGSAGELKINAGSLIVRDGALVTADSRFGTGGNGGKLTVNADTVELIGTSADNDQLVSGLFTSGNIAAAGELTINTGLLIIQDGAAVSTSTSGSGNAGSLTVKASDSVHLIGTSVMGNPSGLSTQSEGAGTAGELTINTPALIVENGAEVTSSTLGAGNGGKLTVNAGSLIVQDGSQVTSSTLGAGNGGKLTVNADRVELKGTSEMGVPSALSTATQGAGTAGDLTINTRSLIVRDGAYVSAVPYSTGAGGTLTVNALDSVELIGTSAFNKNISGLFTSVQPGATGAGGNLTVTTRRLTIQDGARITSSTNSSGAAGNLTVHAQELVELSGTSIDGQLRSRVAAETRGTGNAGNLRIETPQLIVRDRAQVTVSSSSNNPQGAGSIDIQAQTIRLDNQGEITAQTVSGNGGNITLDNIDLLLMSRGSRISTTAGTQEAGGEGGQITINAKNGFIVAFPSKGNNDITANAFKGRGGKVTITAAGIFGIAPLSRQDLQRLRPQDLDPRQLPTNDITAVSQQNPDLSGTVQIITPDIDPNSGLVELPKVPVNPEVAQGCYTPGYAQSSFVITGRGGLPPNPKDILTPDVTQIDWVSAKPSNNNRSLPLVSTKSNISTPKRIVEATAAVLNAQGQIVLTANPSTVTPDTNRQNFIECHGSYRTHI